MFVYLIVISTYSSTCFKKHFSFKNQKKKYNNFSKIYMILKKDPTVNFL